MIRTFFKLIVFIFSFSFFASAVFAESHTYSAFHVKVTGKGQPVILIPGATCSGDEWNETVAHLAGKYECHVLTLAGYAGTQPLDKGPYLETIKNQIEQYISDKKLDHVILIGHSIGGYLSLCIATDMKDHLQKVVIVDAMPFFAGAQNPAAADTFSESQAKRMLSIYEKMDNEAITAYQLNAAKFLCRDSTHWSTIAKWGGSSDRKTLAYTLCEMLGSDIRSNIARINIPVLVLAAYCKMPQYPSFTRESVMETYTDQYKNCSKCTVHTTPDNARHFIMYDAPEWYYNEIDTFLKS